MSASGKLGRNPFQQRAKAKTTPAAEPAQTPQRHLEESAPSPSPSRPKTQTASAIAKFALVDVPATAVVLGLKIFLLARETLSRDDSKK